MRVHLLITILVFSFLTTLAGVKKEKDLAYADAGEENLLDIYHDDKTDSLQDVIVFIHGGSWNSGKKDSYWFLGNNFAKKGKVAVIINYPLSPKVQYKEMAFACAKAVAWVKQNISKYGGNPDRIFVMGHSAGAHLSALINQDPQYFAAAKTVNPIKGVILNDPFGLNMYHYMKLQMDTDDKYMPGFLKVFSKDEKNWIAASPMFKVNEINNPYQIFMGGNTYQSIKIQTPAFYQALKESRKQVYFQRVDHKKHVGMITQMIFGWNQLYKDIIGFMDRV
ncbi:alpha/beta hydrolase [Pelobium sp.]|nr:alpha/beta hydrolase [Pelobium sp.]MDA9555371.1 alpha/beta hydrolase [Pelobium sp.]